MNNWNSCRPCCVTYQLVLCTVYVTAYVKPSIWSEFFCVLHRICRKFQVDFPVSSAIFVWFVRVQKIAETAIFVGVGPSSHTSSSTRSCEIVDFLLARRTDSFQHFSPTRKVRYSLYLSISVESQVENSATSDSVFDTFQYLPPVIPPHYREKQST